MRADRQEWRLPQPSITRLGGGRLAADPFLWLEERTSDRALAWVAEQNTRHGGRVALRPSL